MKLNPQYAEEYLVEILCNLILEEEIYLDKIGFQMPSDYLNNYRINPETRTFTYKKFLILMNELYS